MKRREFIAGIGSAAAWPEVFLLQSLQKRSNFLAAEAISI